MLKEKSINYIKVTQLETTFIITVCMEPENYSCSVYYSAVYPKLPESIFKQNQQNLMFETFFRLSLLFVLFFGGVSNICQRNIPHALCFNPYFPLTMILHHSPFSISLPRKECADIQKKVHSLVQFKYFNIETNFERISVEKYSKEKLRGRREEKV